MAQYGETVWQFKTARFCAELQIEPEETAPEDSFEFQDDIDAVRNGTVEWFCATVVVSWNGREVGRDSLGACAYNSIREFYTSHRDADSMNRNCTLMRRAWQGGNDPDAKISLCHYFPSMVREAIRNARNNLRDVPRLRCA